MMPGESHLPLTASSGQTDTLHSKIDSPSDEHKLDEADTLKMCSTFPGGFSPSAASALYKDYFPALRQTRLVPPPLWSALREW